jgi:branched-chain amino acid aminotransferase
MHLRESVCVFYDGAFVHRQEVGIDLYTQSLHYGTALFEGIRSYQTHDGVFLMKAREHFARLQAGAMRLGMRLSYTVEEMVQIACRLLLKNNLTSAYIRPVLMSGPSLHLDPVQDSLLVMMAWRWVSAPAEQVMHLGISRRERAGGDLAGLKLAANYPNAMLALAAAREQGYDDTILLDSEGYVAQLTGANLFIEKNETLITPPLETAFPGITRHTVLELAQHLHIPVVERRIAPDELLDADSAFTTSTLTGIRPVTAICHHPVRLRWEDSLGYLMHCQHQHLVRTGGGYAGPVI